MDFLRNLAKLFCLINACIKVSLALHQGIPGSVSRYPWLCIKVSLALYQGIPGSASRYPWLCIKVSLALSSMDRVVPKVMRKLMNLEKLQFYILMKYTWNGTWPFVEKLVRPSLEYFDITEFYSSDYSVTIYNYIYTLLACLSFCLFVSNKRQNCWTDRAQTMCGTTYDPRKGLRMNKSSKTSPQQNSIFIKMSSTKFIIQNPRTFLFLF